MTSNQTTTRSQNSVEYNWKDFDAVRAVYNEKYGVGGYCSRCVNHEKTGKFKIVLPEGVEHPDDLEVTFRI